MAFTILVEDENGEGSYEYKWYLSEEKPMPDAMPTFLMATDNELEHIRSEFTGIPMNTISKRVKWTGDFAYFIYDNL